MVAPSRIFHRPLNCNHCSQSILHPGIGCVRHYLDNLLLHGIAGMKYFSPLLITPLVMKFKTMNREFFITTMKYYLQTVVWASVATSSVFFMVCTLRNCLGRFQTYTTLFVPAVLGLQFCWFFPERVMKLFTTATSQATLEGILRQYSNKFTHLILHSPIVQTILFMINSAIILHYKRKNIYKDYWFIQPYEKVNNKDDATTSTGANDRGNYQRVTPKCNHTHKTCLKFILEGIQSYLKYGIPLDILTMIMRGKLPSNTQGGLLTKVTSKLKAFRPNMTAFFITYVGIYRLSSCLLRRYYSHLSLDLQHILSAFLGGASYLCVNKVNFMTMSVVISTQIFWQQFCNSIQTREGEKRPNLVLLLLKNTPFSQIIFAFNGGYLVHNYVLNYERINSLAKGFIDALTCNKTKAIRDTLMKNDLHTLMELAQSKTIKTLL